LAVSVNIDPGKVARAAEHLVRTMDAAMRKFKNTSLVKFIYDWVTNELNVKMHARGIPLRIRPTLRFGVLLQYDVTKGVRLKVLEYISSEYVDYYLGVYAPGVSVKYNIHNVNAVLFTKYRPQMVAFLQGQTSDIAPFMGWLAGYLVEANNLTTLHAEHPACTLCRKIPTSCHKQKKARARRELARRAV